MQPDDTITLSEVLDEAWKLYFSVIKGIALTLTLTANLFVMILFLVAQRAFRSSGRVRSYVQDWDPVRPAVFNLTER